IDSREALIYALNDFAGAVLLITHDVYLAEATADQLWLVKGGKVAPYDGDLADYRVLVMSSDREKAAPAKVAAVEETPADKAEQRRRASQAREAAAPLKKKADAAEKAFEKANARIKTIDAELSKTGLSPQKMTELSIERGKLEAEATKAETEWLTALDAYEAAVKEAVG
ncbi:MAG: glycosyl transferase family 1, partial [Hyphomonas sp. 32-62-5]